MLGTQKRPAIIDILPAEGYVLPGAGRTCSTLYLAIQYQRELAKVRSKTAWMATRRLTVAV